MGLFPLELKTVDGPTRDRRSFRKIVHSPPQKPSSGATLSRRHEPEDITTRILARFTSPAERLVNRMITSEQKDHS